jgi:hypothetical protein
LYSAVSSFKVRGRENLCDKKGKVLHSASLNKPSDTVHYETSCWTDEEIQRTSFDVHFSVVET